MNVSRDVLLTLLHSERPKLYGVLAVLSAIGLMLTTSYFSVLKSQFNVNLLTTQCFSMNHMV